MWVIVPEIVISILFQTPTWIQESCDWVFMIVRQDCLRNAVYF